MAELGTVEFVISADNGAAVASVEQVKNSLQGVGPAAQGAEQGFDRIDRGAARGARSMFTATLAGSGLREALGPIPGDMLHLSHGFEMVGDSGVKMTSSLNQVRGALGNVGTAAIVFATAMAAWKVGTWINDTFNLGKAFESVEASIEKGVKQGGAFSTMIAMVTGQYQRMKAEVAADLLAPVANADLNARRRTNQATQAATDKFTMDLLLKNKQAEIKANEEAFAKETEAAKQHYDKMVELIKKEGEAYAKVQEEESMKQLEELNKRIDQMTAFDMNFKNMNAVTSIEVQKIGQEISDDTAKSFLDAMTANGAMIDGMGERLTEGMDEWKNQWTDFLGFLNGIFGQMLGGGVNAILGLTNAFTSGFSKMKDQFTSGLSDIGRGGFKNILGGIGAIGSAIGPVIGMVGQLFSALKNLFAHNWAKDVANIQGQWGLTFSDALAKQITDLAKKYKDAGTAVVLSLKDIIAAQGVTKDNWNGLILAIDYGFQKWQAGTITTQQLTEQLAAAFPAMADAAIQFGGAYIDQLTQIIAKMKETGVGMEALQSYFDTLKAKIDEIKGAALNDLITQLGKLSDAFGATGGKGKFKELQLTFTLTVQAMIAQGKSMAEIYAAVGPVWEQLIAAADRLGIHTSKAFKDISIQMELYKKYANEISRIDITGKAIADLQKLGVVSKTMFHDFENQIHNLYEKMTAGGATSRSAIEAILPMLIQVLGVHNQTGMAISKQDQALIKLAQSYGLLPQDTSQVGLDPTLTALQNMEKILLAIAAALGAVVTGLNAVGAAGSNIHVGTASTGNYGGGGESIPRAASGPVRHVTRTGLWMLDPGDTVIPPRGNNGQPQSGETHNYYNFYGLTNDELIAQLKRLRHEGNF